MFVNKSTEDGKKKCCCTGTIDAKPIEESIEFGPKLEKKIRKSKILNSNTGHIVLLFLEDTRYSAPQKFKIVQKYKPHIKRHQVSYLFDKTVQHKQLL